MGRNKSESEYDSSITLQQYDDTEKVDDSKLTKKRKLTQQIEPHTKKRRKCNKGTVKLFFQNKGYGFIRWSGGDDLWFHANDVSEECRSGTTVHLYDGDDVEFEVGIIRGKRCALNITMDPDVSRERVHGVVTRWQNERGFGFIKMGDGSPDVFVHRHDLLDGLDRLQEGDRVEFEATKNFKNGKTTAIRVTKVDAPIGPEDDDKEKVDDSKLTKKRKLTQQIEPPIKKRRKSNEPEDESEDSDTSMDETDAVESGDSKTGAHDVPEEKQIQNLSTDPKKRHKGNIKFFDKKKGFGFIKWSGGDALWFHVTGVSEECISGDGVLLSDGDAVQFEIGIDRGRRRAVNVSMDPSKPVERFRGEVSRWRSDKGIGFIKRDDDGGPDIFVHRDKLLDGLHCLQEGDRVEFEVARNDRNGKTMAKRVKKSVSLSKVTKPEEEETGKSAVEVDTTGKWKWAQTESDDDIDLNESKTTKTGSQTTDSEEEGIDETAKGDDVTVDMPITKSKGKKEKKKKKKKKEKKEKKKSKKKKGNRKVKTER